MAKQIKTFTAGSVLTSADVNSYLMAQAVIAAQSTDRPTSPQPGMTIWETDTKRLLVYQSASTLWTPPWNVAWGVVPTTSGGTGGYGFSRSTSTQASAGTFDATNATATFTAYGNRLYRVTGMAAMTHSAASTVGQLIVSVDGAAAGTVNIVCNTAGADRHAVVTTVVTLASGSHTIKLQAASATGTLTLQGSAAQPTIFSVEDAGPAGAPA